MASSRALVEAADGERQVFRPDPLLDHLLDQAAIVVAYSDLLAQHATELRGPHQQILAAIQGAAEQLRAELLAARAREVPSLISSS